VSCREGAGGKPRSVDDHFCFVETLQINEVGSPAVPVLAKANTGDAFVVANCGPFLPIEDLRDITTSIVS